ncbi:hypothetical protein ACMHYB_53720 [Sorangium sp. So ce1128]
MRSLPLQDGLPGLLGVFPGAPRAAGEPVGTLALSDNSELQWIKEERDKCTATAPAPSADAGRLMQQAGAFEQRPDESQPMIRTLILPLSCRNLSSFVQI